MKPMCTELTVVLIKAIVTTKMFFEKYVQFVMVYTAIMPPAGTLHNFQYISLFGATIMGLTETVTSRNWPKSSCLPLPFLSASMFNTGRRSRSIIVTLD